MANGVYQARLLAEIFTKQFYFQLTLGADVASNLLHQRLYE